MKRLLLLGFILIIIAASGCKGQGSDAAAVLSEAEQASSSEFESVSSESPSNVRAAASESKSPLLNPSTPPSNDASMSPEEERAALYLSEEPAKQSWRLAYESFYSGGAALSQELVDLVWNEYGIYTANKKKGPIVLRSDAGIDFIYPIYDMPYEFIQTIIDNGETGGIVQKCLQNSGRYGFLANYKTDNSFAGEGQVILSTDGSKLSANDFQGFEQGKYDNRTSLTVTEGVEAQLLDYGFSPETTRAFALCLPNGCFGVCFLDNYKAVFYHNNEENSGIISPRDMYDFSELKERLLSFYSVCELTKIEAIDAALDAGIYQGALNPLCAKPVIYLYPEQTTNVTVKLGYPKEYFTYTYPTYDNGWHVTAEPDGKLTNLSDGSEHYYLFWEGNKKLDWDFSEGFVVKGSETEDFLREKLAFMGLTPREYNDFITYWVPEMSQNHYNLITFSTEQYEQLAPLTVTPAPDSMLRVHMVYRGLKQSVNIAPQTLVPWQRIGFSVVEWGGSRA